jgi:putative inorganic carbon (hco3(-)) transporter
MDDLKTIPWKEKNNWIFITAIVYILINIFCIANEWYFITLLPVILFIAYLSFFALDKLIYIIVFFVPISLPLEDYAPSLGFNLQIPTEPILAGILVLFILRLIYERKFDRSILLHPISIAIYINLLWILMTSITSSMPVVSFKFLTSRLWFLATFYFIATQLFVKKNDMKRYVWAYIPLMLVVIFFAFAHMAKAGLLNQQAANLSATPFFRDHTSYGCILAMLFPFSIGIAVSRKYSFPFRILSWIMVFIIALALLLSYTRAAWLSILIAGGVFVIVWMRIRFRTIVIIGVILSAFVYANRTELFLDLERNKQNSSKDLLKHVQSIYNIKTDESNVERLNRWHSAFRMFHDRPFWGWGPGTYMFQYAPFQLPNQKTAISTNMGNMGNAHSEYFGPLAESGVIGFLSIVLICILTLYTSVRLYIKAKGHYETRILVMSAMLGLITYYVHGALNDFLDTDKASALFWGYTAMIVALDVYHVRKYGTAETQKS